MNRNDMLVLHITNDYKVSVETMENGVSFGEIHKC